MNPILVALDVDSLGRAEELAASLSPHVGGFKVGLELIMAEGPIAVTAIAGSGLPVFADVKLHDIPNTVKGAVSQIVSHGARWVTAHASGGRAMLEAAVEAAGEEAGVLAVTVLTSLDASDLAATGVARGPEDQVLAMAGLAAATGAEGVVCSPREVELIKATYPGLMAVTPGVRTVEREHDDQKRVATPVEAINAGSDYLVIGRAITAAADPSAAAASIRASLQIGD